MEQSLHAGEKTLKTDSFAAICDGIHRRTTMRVVLAGLCRDSTFPKQNDAK